MSESEKKPGAIYNIERYRRAKMLDHSLWFGILPRGITPSDIDVVFDNDDKMILCELSSSTSEWKFVSKGQRWVYESIIKSGPHCAAICKHDEPEEGHQINSCTDIHAFQVMLYDHEIVITRKFTSNERWQSFVRKWFEDPLRVRRRLLGYYSGIPEIHQPELDLGLPPKDEDFK